MSEEETGKPKGFGAMTPEKRSEVAGRGGKAAHKSGRAHKFSKEQAKIAGSKGGKASHQARRDKSLATPPKEEA